MAQTTDYLGRRQFPRRIFDRIVGVLHQGKYAIYSASAIGEGGLSIFIPAGTIPLNDSVILTFEVPGGSLVAIRAEVRNSFKDKNGRGMVHGFRFDNLAFMERRKIRSYVSARSEREEQA